MTTRTPPAGFTTLTPFLVVEPAAEAIDWYVEVFGATVVDRLDGPAGESGRRIVGQAELDFGTGRLQLSDPMPAFGLAAPSVERPTHGSIVIYVDEVDAVVAAAEAKGAVVREAPADFVSGDRYASIVDPFGQRWAVMTLVEELEPAERIRRVREWWATIAPSLAAGG